jgi:hypothetical protein
VLKEYAVQEKMLKVTCQPSPTPLFSVKSGSLSSFGRYELTFPFSTGFDFPFATACDRVRVRSPIVFTFLDESFVDEGIKIRIEASVMYLFLVVVFELILDREAVRLRFTSDSVQEVSLKASQVVHRPIKVLIR